MQNKLEHMALIELGRGPRTGYELMDCVQEATGKRPSPGSMYPLLANLLENKLIRVKEDGRKKIYSLTKKGEKKSSEIMSWKRSRIYQHLEMIEIMMHLSDQKAEQLTNHVDELINYKGMKDIFPAYAEFQYQCIKLFIEKDQEKLKELKKELQLATKHIKKIR